MSCYFCSSGSYEFTESLDKIAERKLGLTSGVEMAQGLKPTTARETLVNHFLNEREKEFVDIEPLRYEPHHEKTNILVSDLVRHKPGCAATEDG